MSADCLFCRIVAGELPADVVYEDEDTLAFRDINPVAPTHVVVIPKSHHADAASLAAADPALAGAILAAAAEVARREDLVAAGYRMTVNSGPGAGQTVFHAHLHLLGGRAFTWPPG